jgi:hypothetical protein
MKKKTSKDDLKGEPKDTDESKKPKKRGRKPKKKEPVKQEGDMDIQENLIIKLNHSEQKEDPIMAYEDSDNHSKECNENISELCWNCSHHFHKSIVGIPLKYDNDLFYIYGDFCSLECGARYAYEYIPDRFRDIFSLINLYNHKLNPQENIPKPIELAPNKLLLKSFGGKLTIDEYRSNSSNNEYNIILPQIIPLKHITDSQEMSSSTNNKSNYKLYRKSALPSEKKSMKDFITTLDS